MYIWRGFLPESNRIIGEALSFAKSRIEKYGREKKSIVDEAHHGLIDKEIENEVARIKVVEDLIKDYPRNVGIMPKAHYETVMDIINSALDIYLQDTLEAKAKSGLDAFDMKIQEIRRVANSELLKDRKTNLFDKYFETPVTSPKRKKVEVFFSYSHMDRVLAGKMAAFLTQRGIGVFLAHEDIEVSKEWREEIFQHLKSADVLIALLTPNYERSVWANQEPGYMIGKGGKIVPLIVGETQIKKFGFLEALQGISVKEESLVDCFEEILRTIFR